MLARLPVGTAGDETRRANAAEQPATSDGERLRHRAGVYRTSARAGNARLLRGRLDFVGVRYRFDGFEVDTQNREVERDGSVRHCSRS